MRRAVRLLVISVAMLLPAIASAHPDIAITARVLFDVKQGRLAAVAQQWTFDADYGRRLISRFDADENGSFDDAETDALQHRLQSDLAPFAYLAEFTHGGATASLGDPTAFDAVIAQSTVTVTLGFALAHPIALMAGKQIEMTIRDPDYIAALRFAADKPVVLRSDGSLNCESDVLDSPEKRYFGGMAVPQSAVLTCR